MYVYSPIGESSLKLTLFNSGFSHDFGCPPLKRFLEMFVKDITSHYNFDVPSGKLIVNRKVLMGK
jgi:hypothetical protein